MTQYFEELQDPRQQSKVHYNMIEIIVMTICAVMYNLDHWEDIAVYCTERQEWFKEHFHMKLEFGVPSHDTFQRIWGLLNPKEFEKCFGEWVSSIGKTYLEKLSV